MITRRTKLQLMVFVIITLVGVSYVGARYAQLDRYFIDDSYNVTAHFTESGGIFAGADVTYRGVSVGQVRDLELTDDGVDVILRINDDWDEIPADAEALVANKSAVGEQYVDLLPQSDGEPYLTEDSEIADTRTDIPIPTAKLLTDIARTTADVDKDALRTVVSEFGLAFDGTGESLGRIIDTSNSFIETANANFDITRTLIRDGNTVLDTQLAKASAIRNFSKKLALFSGTLVDADQDIRRVIDAGSPAADELRTFIEDNEVPLGSLLNNLVTTGEITVRHLDGIEQLLVLYPYVVEGGFTVVSRDPVTGKFDAHFGMVETPHELCQRGYIGPDQSRDPVSERGNAPMVVDARCEESAAESNARGAQHAPRPRAGADYSSQVAVWDRESGEVTWLDEGLPGLHVPGSVAAQDVPSTHGEESWKWVLTRPLVPTTD